MFAAGGIYMIISDTIASQPSIPDQRFQMAGWACFLWAFIFIWAIVSGILAQLQTPVLRLLLFVYILTAIFCTVCGIYIQLQFRRLLNERYNFYALDKIIIWQIIIVSFSTSVYIFRVTITTLIPSLGIILIPLIGICIIDCVATGIIGIIFGTKLLAIHDDTSGLIRAYAIINIIGASCFAIFILFPIALLMLMPNNVICGLIFLKPVDAEEQVEFV
jgi:hypothetical protein